MPRAKKKSDTKSAFTVHIPDAVKKQSDLADEKQAALQPKDAIDDGIIEDKIEDDPPAPPEPVKPDTVPPVDVAPVNQASPSEWEGKYKVLQGKYNTEIAELRSVVMNLQNLVNQQSGLIQQLQSAPAPQAPAVMPQASQADFDIKPLNPDDFSGYGDDIRFMAQGFNQLLEVNKKQADIIAKIQAGDSGHGVDPRLERVEAFMTETAQDRYNRELDTNMPKWREVIYTDDFVGWLNGVDPVSNYRYRDMFDYAQKNFRHGQAAALLNRYAMERQIDLSSGQPGNGKPAIVDNTRTALHDQVMPDESTGDNTPAVNPQNQQREQYPTQQDVAKASDLYAQGKITAKKFNEISDRFMVGLRVGAVKPS